MGLLRRAIPLIAATIVLASPSTAEIVKFKILKIDPPSFEGRALASVRPYDRILASATIAAAPHDPHNMSIDSLRT